MHLSIITIYRRLTHLTLAAAFRVLRFVNMFDESLPQSMPSRTFNLTSTIVRLRLLEFVFAIPVTVLLALEERRNPLHWGIIIVWFSAFVSLFSLLLSRHEPLAAGPHRRYSAASAVVAISDLIAAIALLVWFVLQVVAICRGRQVAPGYFASLMLGYGWYVISFVSRHRLNKS